MSVFLASLPISDDRKILDEFLDEHIDIVSTNAHWHLYFDGATNQSSYGIVILLISPQGVYILRFVHLAFIEPYLAMNNIVEYETRISRLEATLELGIKEMEVFRDSNLVIRQILRDRHTKYQKLGPYHTYLATLVSIFNMLTYTQLYRAENQFADALVTLASIISEPTNTPIRPLQIKSRSTRTYCYFLNEATFNNEITWYQDIYDFLQSSQYPTDMSGQD